MAFKWVVVVYFFVLCLCDFGDAVSLDDTLSISRVLESVLKIQPPTEFEVNKTRHGTLEHMLAYYRKYNSLHPPEQVNDNIIRSIYPLQDSWINKKLDLLSTLLIFNLTCVQADEDVYSAQLNLDPHDFHWELRKTVHRRKRFSLPFTLRIFRFSVQSADSPLEGVEIGYMPFDATSKLLQIDISSYLREALSSAPQDLDVLIAIRLQTPEGKPVSSVGPPRASTMNRTRPRSFLMVFSEEKLGPSPLHGVRRNLLASVLNSSHSHAETSGVLDDSRTTHDMNWYGLEDFAELEAVKTNRHPSRRRRSLKDNELTEDDDNDYDGVAYWVSQPQPKPAIKKKSSGKSKNKIKSQLNEHVIGRRWKDCRRRRLTINFADIGWGDWILSPRTFEAYYCDGVCSYPLTRAMRPTNHATLQSMVRAVGGNTGVPDPKCVPDSLSSITLLYIDQGGNVVLKNYPAMSVRSCACR